MRFLCLISAILLASLTMAQSALARSRDAEPVKCTAANSKSAEVADLWQDGRRLRGDCVALNGYRAGDVIFTDQRAFYAYHAKRARAPAGIVGIPYPGIRSEEEGLMRGTYFGRVALCSDDRRAFRRSLAAVRRAAQSGEIVLVHLYGFCANSGGPAVRVDTADESPAHDLVRLMGEDLRLRFGELLDPPAGYRYPAALAFLAGVATDGACVKDYAPGAAPPGPPEGKGVPTWRPRDDPRRTRALALWCATTARQTRTYLVSLTSPSAFEAGVALDMVHCVCTTEDCANRWPVALLDTGWEAKRPYLCQRVKLRPRVSSVGEGEPPEYSEFSYEFADDNIADGARGFPERSNGG